VNLTGKQKRHLRSLGNALSPVVRLGKSGIDDGVIAALDTALTQHELVKLKLNPESPDDKHEAAERLASATHSQVAQIMGGTILLYRRHPKKPTIRLPNASGELDAVVSETAGRKLATTEPIDDDLDDEDANNDE
jgi:RNA-binding protein